MSKSDFTCVAWFSDVTKALEYTVDGNFKCHLEAVSGTELLRPWIGCRIDKRRITMYDASFDDGPFDFDTVIEKVNSSTVGDGWAVWVRKPKTEWTEWTEWAKYIHNHAPDRREYRVVDNGSVEYREKKNG